MDAVHIVGAGGIGCAVGYALRSAGVPVLLVEANWKKVEVARRRGDPLRVRDRSGNLIGSTQAEFIHFEDWRPVQGSWVLLCTKCYDNAAVLARLTVPVRLLPIQNGFDPRLQTHGHDYEGIASFVSQCLPGESDTRITREGELHLGRLAEGQRDDMVQLADALGRCRLFRVRVVSNILPFKHAKLMYNAAISPLAAAAGLDNGELLSIPVARKLFFALLQENYRILSAAGIRLGKVGPFHPRTVAWILRRKWLSRLMAKSFEPSLRGTYCSMAGEIQKGRTEIDNYNGH
ncbi:MAG TPA: ketopantoate reductase C-terminal domain-containing protein, partial [Gemmata sp.]|nr:ketopantoate reductase C-terminal domain-containing protein [Gemmata sp.]